jgi:DNA-binding transcriptional ArsR family regulator
VNKTFLCNTAQILSVNMVKETYHPNAYLSSIKNVKRGLKARTRVLSVLERHSVDAKTVGSEAGMPYTVVMHHLKLLKSEGIVERKGDKPYLWLLTGLGQKRLVNSG